MFVSKNLRFKVKVPNPAEMLEVKVEGYFTEIVWATFWYEAHFLEYFDALG